ncbi:MAG TPA: hypothetical protein VFQ53_14390 [Kofleriaceae bacterium]|nr:hypothetical protein [Kofleriaceae bacterium]
MKRIFVVLVVLGTGLVLADAQPAAPAVEAKHFSHAEHKKRGVDTESPDKCQNCHSIDAKGQVLAPAAQGHAPCLSANCHATEFLAVGEKARKAKPADFQKASGFCLGCHAEVPWPWKKPTLNIIHAWRNQREHHVEMPHFLHTQMKGKDNQQIGCRSCHVVEEKTFKLAVGRPGHAECATCHNAKDFPEHTMLHCGNCHKAESRQDWLTRVLTERHIKIDPKKGIEGSRPGSDVRACDSAGQADFDKKKKRKTPCFKHETEGHRTTKDAKDVQCAQCHFAIGDRSRWGGRTLESIEDLHTNKIIGVFDDKATKAACSGQNDSQHAACSGGTACHTHKRQVDLACAESNCTLCHANATSKNEPF